MPRCPSMNRILSRALGAAAVAGVAALAGAAPACADPAPSGLVGSELGVIGLVGQNSAVHHGNTAGSAGHSANSQNAAQQVVTDAQSVDVLKNAEVLEKPLVLV